MCLNPLYRQIERARERERYIYNQIVYEPKTISSETQAGMVYAKPIEPEVAQMQVSGAESLGFRGLGCRILDAYGVDMEYQGLRCMA